MSQKKIRLFYRGPNKVALAREVLDDPRFLHGKLGALGLLWYLASISGRGYFRQEDVLAAGFKNGETRRLLKHLVEIGYVRLVPLRSTGNSFVGARYAVNRYVSAPPLEGPEAATSAAVDNEQQFPPRENGTAWIYAVSAGGAVKIGGSVRVAQRFERLQAARTIPLRFEFAYGVPASRSATIERRAHLALAGYLLAGEWFACAPGAVEGVIEQILVDLEIPLRRFPEAK